MGDLLALAQAVAFEAVAERHEALVVVAETTHFGQPGYQHRGLELQRPAAVGALVQLALGGAADRHLLPVGGVLRGKGFQGQGAGRQAEQNQGKR
ncbi:hypothetical protein D3C78_1426580 [compost metagenome]